MCKYLLFLFVTLPTVLGDDTEIFDVTTIFKPGDENREWHIHSRTNALGLPLIGDIGRIMSSPTDFNYTIENNYIHSTCEAYANNCTWQIVECPLEDYDAGLVNHDIIHRYNPTLLFKLDSTYGQYTYGYLMFLANEKSGFYDEISYIIRFRMDYSNFQVTLVKSCNLRFNSNTFQFPLHDPIIDNNEICYCEAVEEFSQWFNIEDKILIRFDEYITVTINSITLGGNGKWTNDLNVKYYKFYGNSIDIKRLIPAYSCKSPESELISPKLNTNSTQVYLVLEYNPTTSQSETWMFEVFAEDSQMEIFDHQIVNDKSVGWNIVHLKLNVPSNVSGPISIRIKKNLSSNISISRILILGENEEVVTTSYAPVDISRERFGQYSKYVITATSKVLVPVNKRIDSNTTFCFNGGILTEAGCACPPGFSNSQCEQGCGRNRFGQDCGGICSLHKSECKGLILCTNPTGCHCASGYKGDVCDRECDVGTYGNDCSQVCGHCYNASPCDIYTGECTGYCEPGYLPPICKFESVYYSLKPWLTSPEFGTIHVSFNPRNYSAKFGGSPELYQIQYKEKMSLSTSSEHQRWSIYVNKKIEKNSDGSIKEYLITEKIKGLRDGINYQVRVLLMDENFYKYDGDLVQPAEITSKCEIPEMFDCEINVEKSTDSLLFTWNYDKFTNTSQHWCPVESFEVAWKEDWQWFSIQTYNKSFNITDLLPGMKVSFKVRAKTASGFSPYSSLQIVSTIKKVPSPIRNLEIESVGRRSSVISWAPPLEAQGEALQYFVSYKCVKQPACLPGCQNVSEGHVTVKDTQITLEPLTPFTRYMVSVAPDGGSTSSVYVGIPHEVPTEVPKPSTRSPLKTNTSVTVFWDDPVVCSSFHSGYNYQLVKEMDSYVLDSGFTKNTSVSFHNLTASTQFIVKVYVVTIAGWNPGAYLAINVSTSATVPEAVRQLTVYKRSKGMLGLRWALPRSMFGQLKSFTVTYSLDKDDASHAVAVTVEPKRCVVWPQLFCHTIEGLRTNRRYNLTVSARNMEIQDDGEIASVVGVTKENSPTAPRELKLLNTSSTSVTLQWQYPDLANGILRSFLISVEETENYDQDSCCQIYPLVETFVNEEAVVYETEVSGLHPASTYFVSVSAKTVGMGPSQPLVVQTRPPHLPLTLLPRLEVTTIDNEPLSWLPQQTTPYVNNTDIYIPLIKAHLLLAQKTEATTDSVENSGITDPQLDSLLATYIKKPFFFIAEYSQEDIISLDSTGPSTWGNRSFTFTSDQKYELIAVQVSEYNGAFNVDLRFSNTSTLVV